MGSAQTLASSSSLLSTSTDVCFLLPLESDEGFSVLQCFVNQHMKFTQCILDSTNYHTWQVEAEQLLRIFYYDSFVCDKDSPPCPNPKVMDPNKGLIDNHAYREWMTVNFYLRLILLDWIGPSILPLVRDIPYVKDIWFYLFDNFGHFLHPVLISRLSNVSKGRKSMDIYLSEVKNLAERLRLASWQMPDKFVMLHTLRGLSDEEFKDASLQILTRSDSMTLNGFHKALMATETTDYCPSTTLQAFLQVCADAAIGCLGLARGDSEQESWKTSSEKFVGLSYRQRKHEHKDMGCSNDCPIQCQICVSFRLSAYNFDHCYTDCT